MPSSISSGSLHYVEDADDAGAKKYYDKEGQGSCIGSYLSSRQIWSVWDGPVPPLCIAHDIQTYWWQAKEKET